ncbi:hypothetical protein HK101_005811, partial [Irineochytrium annulatum]
MTALTALVPSPSVLVSAGAVAVAAAYVIHLVLSTLVPTPPRWLVGSLDPATGPPRPRPHRLYLGRTTHTRIAPVGHSFAYRLFYVGMNLNELERPGARKALPIWPLFGLNRHALLSIWDKDFLGPLPGVPDPLNAPTPPIRTRLMRHLAALGIPAEEVGEVELVTMPRVVGVAFNPLNTYYCFEPARAADWKTGDDAALRRPNLRAVLLEVNNTFGERHLYLCDERNRMEPPRAGYTTAHEVKRAFHVSPFNNRSGVYEAHIHDVSDGKMDVILIIRRYTSELEQSPPTSKAAEASEKSIEPATFMARVQATAYTLNAASVAHLIVVYPFTAFMTFPRILYQASRLAYARGLKVYQRPNPFRAATKEGGTIRRKKMDAFQRFCQERVLLYLQRQAAAHGADLILTLMTHEVIPFIHSSTTPIRVHLNSPNLFLRLVTDGDEVGRALSSTFARGDWACSRADLPRFLALFTRAREQPPAQLQDIQSGPRGWIRSARRWYNGDRDGAMASSNPRGNPFKSSAFVRPLVDVRVEWRETLTACKGILSVAAEEAWFRTITTFAWDPYRIASRVDAYVGDMEEEELRESEGGGDGDG